MAKPPPGPESADLPGQKLQRLRQQFHRGLAARADEIEAAPTRQALYEALHRLAGAAGCYGDLELSDLARRILHGLPLDAAQTQPVALTQPMAKAVQAVCVNCRALARAQAAQAAYVA